LEGPSSSPVMSRRLASSCALVLVANGVVLRKSGMESTDLGNSSALPTNAEIKAKWDKMDDFLEIMFTLACKWKHGKDIHGKAVEYGSTAERGGKLVNAQQVMAYKEELRAKNVQQLNSACGMIVANGKGKCQRGCAERWGDAMTKRVTCSDKCTTAYANFETSCRTKAANLQKVYAMKVQMAESRETCYEGYCSKIPTAWMKADAAAMSAEVDTQCNNQCSAAAIETRCEQKWQLEVDFLRGSVEQKCHDESIVVSCFEAEKGKASTAYDTCTSTNKGTCDTQFADCKTKGNVDNTFASAKEFCEKRKTMCTEQVTQQCLDENKGALEAAKSKCEQDAKTGEETCVSDGLTAKETETKEQCKTDLAPKCVDECKKTCQVDKMNQCLTNLADTGDPAEMFCTDFWKLLHDSTEVDPLTGDPIVLLARA